MDKRKKCHELIEVIWKREDGRNSRELNCLPEVKEINLEDSVQRPAKFKSSSEVERINKNNKELAHKRVRRSLFPENKVGKLNKRVDVNESNEKRSKPRELMRLRSSKIVSNVEKARQNQDTSARQFNQIIQCQKSLSSTVQDPSVILSSVTAEDKIIPLARDFNHSELFDVSNKKLNSDNNNLEEINLSHQNTLNCDNNKLVEYHYDLDCSRKMSNNNLSKASETVSCSNSSLIPCDPEKNIVDLTTSFVKQNRPPFQPSKTFKALHPRSVHETSVVECFTYNQKQINPHTLNVCQSNSPEIMSSRKRYHEHNGSSETKKVLKHDNLNAFTKFPKESRCVPRELSINSMKKSDSLLKASKILSRPKSPIILSQEKTKRDPEASFCESTLYPPRTATKMLKTETSVYEKSTVECFTNDQKQINPRTLDVLQKSPEIVSIRKRYHKHKGSSDSKNVLKHGNLSVTINVQNENNCISRELAINSNKKSDNLLEASKILSRPMSPIISSRENTKRDPEASFCESTLYPPRTATKLLKTESSVNKKSTTECFTNDQKQINSRTLDVLQKSPEIVSIRKRYKHKGSSDSKNVLKHDNLSATTNVPNESNCISRELSINSRKKSDSLLEASKILFRPMFPIILSREKTKRDREASFCESTLYPPRTAAKMLKTESSVHEKSTIECFTNDQKQMNPRALDVLQKSPEIVSIRKRYHKHKGSSDFKNVLKHDNLSATINVQNENNCIPRELSINSRKKSDSLLEASKILFRPKSPIISSQGKTKKDAEAAASICESKLYLPRTAKMLKTETSTVECSTNDKKQQNPRTLQCQSSRLDVPQSKSPEIVSSRKRYHEHDDSLDKKSIFKHDNLNMTTNMLNESHRHSRDSLISPKKMSDSQSKASQILSYPNSQTFSCQGKTKRDPEASLCESKDPSNTAKIVSTESSPQFSVDERIIKSSKTNQNEKVTHAIDVGLIKSPELVSNRNCNLNKSNKSNDEELKVTDTNTDTSITKYCNHVVTNLKNKCDNLSEAPKTSFCLGSSQIISNRKKTKTNKDTWVSDSKRCLLPILENSRAVELLHSHLAGDELVINTVNTAQNQVNPCQKYALSGHKSPEIMTNRKRHIRTNILEFDKCHESDNSVSNKKKRSYSVPEASQLFPYTKVPQIIPNREKMNAIQDKLSLKSKKSLFQNAQSTKMVEVLPSCTVRVPTVESSNFVPDKSKLSTDQEILKSESPEIKSNQRHNRLKFSFEETNASIYDNRNMNKFELDMQAPAVNSNRKSETNVKNTHSNNVLIKSNAVYSEDIVESSEIIGPKQTKHLSKKNKIHCNRKHKSKQRVCKKQDDELLPFVDIPEINLEGNEFKSKIEIMKTDKNKLCSESVNSSMDIIHTDNLVKSPIIESIVKEPKKRLKSIITFQVDQNPVGTELKPNGIQRCPVLPPLSDTKKLINNNVKDDLLMLKPHKQTCLSKDRKKKSVNSDTISTEISVIPATPEQNVVNGDKIGIENFSETFANVSIPLIEVDQSPKTPRGKNQHLALIQSIYSPPNEESLRGFFEPTASPTQCPSNTQRDVVLPFKIDCIISPATSVRNDSLFSPECRKKISNNSPSPNHFDSAKKRKKVCKDGLRGQFRELISRKKSEACIREYEKTLSKNYQPKNENDFVLLYVIELWKEFNTFVLFCYRQKSETEVQKVLITLDNCPKNVVKESIIRIYSPWCTIESKIIDILMYVGVIHVEVLDCPGPSKHLRPSESFSNFTGLLTTLDQSEVLWKCNCSKDAACQCLGELSVFNYLQYMVSHHGVRDIL